MQKRSYIMLLQFWKHLLLLLLVWMLIFFNKPHFHQQLKSDLDVPTADFKRQDNKWNDSTIEADTTASLWVSGDIKRWKKWHESDFKFRAGAKWEQQSEELLLSSFWNISQMLYNLNKQVKVLRYLAVHVQRTSPTVYSRSKKMAI